MQATGRDARKRKQYRYHAQWSAVRGDGKFDRIVAFGQALPRLRRVLHRDLALSGWPREKVLALVVAVMADTLVRVGNAGYARENKSFGLTTLRNRHAEFTGSQTAKAILADWDAYREKFVKVYPHEYKRALTEMAAAQPARNRVLPSRWPIACAMSMSLVSARPRSPCNTPPSQPK